MSTSKKGEANKPATPSSGATPPPPPTSSSSTTTSSSKATTTTATTPSTKPVAVSPPSKKEPELPKFEKGMVDEVSRKFGDLVKIIFVKPLRIKIQVEPQNIVEVATFLRDSMGFDHAESVAGTDYPKDNQIEVVYHLGSYSREDLGAHIFWLAARTNRDDARLPTLINVFKSVEYHERECYEMLGVYFEGHPRNERFLLPEDWADIPPLRKDFRIKGR